MNINIPFRDMYLYGSSPTNRANLRMAVTVAYPPVNIPVWCCFAVFGTNHSNYKWFVPKMGLRCTRHARAICRESQSPSASVLPT